MPQLPKSCLNCSGASLYTRQVRSGGLYSAPLLPGLGRLMHFATLHVVVCADCGHVMFFAEEEARKKVSSTRVWKPV